ncbi:hypothetical protein [Bradyrhizobium ivorense]|uniref:hypothetical protein n=1 Tax=Bradyrhizobium ivorense TaxID=2511166 RepID=UPI001116793D|nr:hypothetical protein [Bradyrhizobium ivorense]
METPDLCESDRLFTWRIRFQAYDHVSHSTDVTEMSRSWRIAAAGLGLVVVATGMLWNDLAQTNRTIFFHLARSESPVIFGAEREELLKLRGRGAGRIRSAIAQQGRLQVQQYAISRQGDGRFRIGPEKQIELTQADAPLVRFGALCASIDCGSEGDLACDVFRRTGSSGVGRA